MIAALDGDFRGLHACWTTAYNDKRGFAPGLGKNRAWEALFVTSSGCLDTAQAEVESHTSNAILVARDAQANRFRAALARLACKFWVADLATHDIYHIGQSFTQDTFCLHRIFNTPSTEDR